MESSSSQYLRMLVARSTALSVLQILGLGYRRQVKSNITSALQFAYGHTIATVLCQTYIGYTRRQPVVVYLNNSLSPD